MVDLLILTSCIQPTQQDNLKLLDWKERYNQTIACLKFYIESGAFSKILICDGSGYGLRDDAITKYASNHFVEFESLSFLQNQELVKMKGKGAGEGEIMAYIVQNSKLFKECSSFIKVTGRLVVGNIVELVGKMTPTETPYFNIMVSRVRGSVDTRVYGISTSMYANYFIDAYKNVDDNAGETYEIVFGRILKSNNIKYKPLPLTPILIGKSGTDNKAYQKDVTYYVSVIMTKIGLMNTNIALFVLGIIKVFTKISKRIKRQQ